MRWISTYATKFPKPESTPHPSDQGLDEISQARRAVASALSATNRELAERYQDNVALLNRLMLGTVVLMLVVLAGALWSIKLLIRPLAVMRRHVESIAAGNLENAIERTGRDEIGDVVDRLSDMQDRLADLIGRIVTTADSIRLGRGEIAKGNADLSRRTEEQASSLEQTASSMEQLTSTVRQNAENAKQANALFNEAERAAGADRIGQSAGGRSGCVDVGTRALGEACF